VILDAVVRDGKPAGARSMDGPGTEGSTMGRNAKRGSALRDLAEIPCRGQSLGQGWLKLFREQNRSDARLLGRDDNPFRVIATNTASGAGAPTSVTARAIGAQAAARDSPRQRRTPPHQPAVASHDVRARCAISLPS